MQQGWEPCEEERRRDAETERRGTPTSWQAALGSLCSFAQLPLSGDESSQGLAHAPHCDAQTARWTARGGNVCTSHYIIGLATYNAY